MELVERLRKADAVLSPGDFEQLASLADARLKPHGLPERPLLTAL